MSIFPIFCAINNHLSMKSGLSWLAWEIEPSVIVSQLIMASGLSFMHDPAYHRIRALLRPWCEVIVTREVTNHKAETQ